MMQHHSNPAHAQLAQLTDWRDEITLVPYSGTQMLDFGFRLDALELKNARFIERAVGGDDAREEWALLPLTGDGETDEEIEAQGGPDDDPYSVRPVAALEPFLSKWVPVPILRIRNDRGAAGEEKYDPGPSAWARMRVVELDTPDPATGHTHRVQLALDTMLMQGDQSYQYLAPDHMDAEKSRDFRFVSDPAGMDWFLRRLEPDSAGEMLDLQKWVSDWLEEMFMAHKRAERPGRRITREGLAHKFEHWARYLACLRLIDHAVSIPKFRLANTVGGRESVAPVEVDLVLDVGNSRTCGILIERFPGETRADLARSFPLEIRDLSRPEFHYSGLFESRVEFSEHRMGDERFASRSGRRNGFLWPSFVRIGPEALRLVASEEGTETASGLSSPKRYLWDDTPVLQDWRFHHHSDAGNLPKSLRAAMRHMNEAGEVLEQIKADEAARLRPRGKTSLAPAISSRLKVMTEMDIANRHSPQDGQTNVRIGQKGIDIRMSVIPTIHGERIVLRLLDQSQTRLDLDDLGMNKAMQAQLMDLIDRPNGMVLVTGPTGSGKTTTLYAALGRVDCATRNVMTIEDPVEYRLDGISQMQVNPKRNVTFATGLRALLRRSGSSQEGVSTVGPIHLDSRRHLVTVEGCEVDLTRTEFSILELLMRNEGIVLERSTIYDRVWGYDFGGSSRSLDVHVGYLRRKLERDGMARLIDTVRGVGFTIRAPDSVG